jgi:hypothetical protein
MCIPAQFINGEMTQNFQNGVAAETLMASLGHIRKKLKSFSLWKNKKAKGKSKQL